MKKILKKYGFTLAEVLIVLGIIGVVAEMTIPTLMNNVQDMQFKSAWKKEYSSIAQVVAKMAYDNGGSLKGVLTSSNVGRDAFKQYLRYTKECDNGASFGNCWASDYKTLNNQTAGWDNSAGLILQDGTSLMFATSWGPNCDWVITPQLSICGYIPVDVNGPFKEPNTMGRDIFSLWILEDHILPEGCAQDGRNNCNTSDTGSSCSAKYLYE